MSAQPKSFGSLFHEIFEQSFSATPSKAWPYWTDAYQVHCGEKCLPPNDPDSALDFIETWAPDMGDIGVCGDCGESCRAKFNCYTELESYGNALASRYCSDYLGSQCCKAEIYDSTGTEIDGGML